MYLLSSFDPWPRAKPSEYRIEPSITLMLKRHRAPRNRPIANWSVDDQGLCAEFACLPRCKA